MKRCRAPLLLRGRGIATSRSGIEYGGIHIGPSSTSTLVVGLPLLVNARSIGPEVVWVPVGMTRRWARTARASSKGATAAAKQTAAQPEEKQRIDKLKELLKGYSEAYYNTGTSAVSDSEYDALFRELQDLEMQFPEYIAPDSPTQTVGAPISKEDGLKHRNPMLSLTNAYDFEDLSKFDARAKGVVRPGDSLQYVCELKYDGMAVSLLYSKGRFVRALTRGDGKVGEDITSNILAYVKHLPRRIEARLLPEALRETDFEVRGEAIMRKKEFERLNQLQEQGNGRLYSNARNLVAGLLNRKLEQTKAKQDINLEIMAYYFDENIPEGGLDRKTHWERLSFVKTLGFQPDPCAVLCPSIKSVMKFISEWDVSKGEDSKNANKRENYPYGIDGIVVKVNSLEQQKQLGFTGRVPKWAVAYKFDAMKAVAKLLDIQFQVGRTGKATPVAVLSPVNLAGSVIERATLHNIDYIVRNGIKKGAMVLVEKGGDVIPKISGVVSGESDSGVEDHPDWGEMVCPCKFASPLVQKFDAVDIYCEHEACPEKMMRLVEHFAGRDCMKITGLGEGSIRLLYDEGFITDLPSIYKLKDRRSEMIGMPGWGTKKVDSLLASIEESKAKVNMATVLYGLGIPHVGKQTAELLAEKFKTFDQLIEALNNNALLYIRGLGYAVGDALVTFFSVPENREMVASLCHEVGLATDAESGQEETQLVSDAYLNKTVMFTGTMSALTREEAGQKVKERGGQVAGTISKSCTILVCGDKASPQKVEKAQKLGVQVMTEEEFLATL